MASDVPFEIEFVATDDLKDHPRNYRKHPSSQIDEIIRSIENHDVYRNVVISADGYILAGHGVREAMSQMGRDVVPVYRMGYDHDSPKAIKLLAGDNEIANLAENSHEQLVELLREIHESNEGGGYQAQGITLTHWLTFRKRSQVKAKK
jgi:hypothetical protein